MRIEITGFATAVRYGPTWDAIQNLLRSMFADDEGVLTRIALKDGQCNYRDMRSEYDLTFRYADGLKEADVTFAINPE